MSLFFLINCLEQRLFPINHIQVSIDTEEISNRQAKQIVENNLKGFFSTDVMHIKNQLASLPNTDKIHVKRIWPDTLLVDITSQKLIGKWGKQCAITSKGIIVAKNVADEDLPAFNGPEDQSFCMLEKYQLMSDQLKNLGLRIAKLELNDRRSWQLVLNNGVQLMLGRKDVDHRLLRFVSVWPKINHLHHGDIAVVDLRYANGIAVCPIQTGEKSNSSAQD